MPLKECPECSRPLAGLDAHTHADEHWPTLQGRPLDARNAKAHVRRSALLGEEPAQAALRLDANAREEHELLTAAGAWS